MGKTYRKEGDFEKNHLTKRKEIPIVNPKGLSMKMN